MDRARSVQDGVSHTTAPVRPHPAIRLPRTTDGGTPTGSETYKRFRVAPLGAVSSWCETHDTPCLDAIP